MGKQRWIKIPAPGEMRGEGKWMKLGNTLYTDEQWEAVRIADYLPTAECDEHPDDSDE